jgi:hypothetical protein
MTSPWQCASCGVPGRISTIAVDPKDTRPILRIDFGSGKPRLLCHLCMVPTEGRHEHEKVPQSAALSPSSTTGS